MLQEHVLKEDLKQAQSRLNDRIYATFELERGAFGDVSFLLTSIYDHVVGLPSSTHVKNNWGTQSLRNNLYAATCVLACKFRADVQNRGNFIEVCGVCENVTETAVNV